MSDLSKNKILKELSVIYNQRTYDGTNYTEEGKSLSVEELNIKTNIRIDELNNLLKSLAYNDYIKSTCLHGKSSTYYYITDKGFDALSDKRFIWYSLSLDKIFNLVTIIISVLALVVAIVKE